MKKTELKRLRPLKASAQMLLACRSDLPEQKVIPADYSRRRYEDSVPVYRYYRFYDAEVENGILKVGIWQRGYLHKGKEPDFTIYISRERKKWLTWGLGRWQEAMIFNLIYVSHRGEIFGAYHWNSKKALKTVTRYLGMDAATVAEAVRKWQVSVKEKCSMYHKSELEEIDEFMQSVPDLPEGFNDDWLIKTAYRDKTSILYHPGRKVTEGLCTRCQTWVKITDKPKHLKETVCPHCKTAAVYRSWNKQQEISNDKTVGILQRVTGSTDYCLTQYHTRLSYQREYGYSVPQITRKQVERFRISENFIRYEIFEINEYKNTGVRRWCHARQRGMGYSTYYPTPYCVLYERNLTKLFKDTELKYIPVREYIMSEPGGSIDVSDLFENMLKYTETVEKLLKAGFYRLTKELIEHTSYRMEDDINAGAERLEDILRLDKVKVRMAAGMECNVKELEVLQAAHRANVTVDAETVRDVAVFYGYHNEALYLILARKNLKKMMSYLKKLHEAYGGEKTVIARDYEDYLEQLDRLGIPQDKHSRFPANFYHVHEELSEQIRELEDRVKKADTRKKNRLLKQVIRQIAPLYDTESDSYLIVWPKSKQDFTREGQLQHNCVGGYFERCAMNRTTVFFVRKKEEPDTPFCTVEFKKEKMIQCRTAYNKDAPEDVMKYMKQISRHYEEMCRQTLREGA